jgi:long-chain acyl-CoA synthetase
MFVRILKLPDDVRRRYDVSSLKGAIHAAAPCPVDVKAKMIEWWGPILIKGWSTLGDVGYLDKDGFLYLTDRKSYMIISGGVNIYPQETEDVLITHPAVADVAVFGVPNEEMGEEVKAVVQPHDMAHAGKKLEEELMLFCRKHLSPIKCPRSIDFEAELPRTPTGKLVKRHLRGRYWPKTAVRT